MTKMTVREIDQAYKEDYTEQDASYDEELRFVEPDHDEYIEEPYDYTMDNWLFEDDYEGHSYENPYDDYDPYPHEDDYL